MIKKEIIIEITERDKGESERKRKRKRIYI